MKKENNLSELKLLNTLLLVLFIGLKLCHQIDWSWWWVLAPIWIWFPLTAIVILILFGLKWRRK